MLPSWPGPLMEPKATSDLRSDAPSRMIPEGNQNIWTDALGDLSELPSPPLGSGSRIPLGWVSEIRNGKVTEEQAAGEQLPEAMLQLSQASPPACSCPTAGSRGRAGGEPAFLQAALLALAHSLDVCSWNDIQWQPRHLSGTPYLSSFHLPISPSEPDCSAS